MLTFFLLINFPWHVNQFKCMRLREQKTLFLIFCKVADFSTSKINILKKERFTNEKVIDIMKIWIAQVVKWQHILRSYASGTSGILNAIWIFRSKWTRSTYYEQIHSKRYFTFFNYFRKNPWYSYSINMWLSVKYNYYSTFCFISFSAAHTRKESRVVISCVDSWYAKPKMVRISLCCKDCTRYDDIYFLP